MIQQELQQFEIRLAKFWRHFFFRFVDKPIVVAAPKVALDVTLHDLRSCCKATATHLLHQVVGALQQGCLVDSLLQQCCDVPHAWGHRTHSRQRMHRADFQPFLLLKFDHDSQPIDAVLYVGQVQSDHMSNFFIKTNYPSSFVGSAPQSPFLQPLQAIAQHHRNNAFLCAPRLFFAASASATSRISLRAISFCCFKFEVACRNGLVIDPRFWQMLFANECGSQHVCNAFYIDVLPDRYAFDGV